MAFARWLPWLLSLVCVWPATGYADGRRDFEDAIVLYENLESTRAIQHFQAALDAGDLALDDRALCYLYLGAAYSEIGRSSEAEISFARAFDLLPSVETPDGVSRASAEAIQGARERAARALIEKDVAVPKLHSESERSEDAVATDTIVTGLEDWVFWTAVGGGAAILVGVAVAIGVAAGGDAQCAGGFACADVTYSF